MLLRFLSVLTCILQKYMSYQRSPQKTTLFGRVQSVQQLLAGMDRPAAVVLCVTPSGMALFDLPVGSHCTATVLSLYPSEFNIWKAWIRSLPLFSKWKSSFHIAWFSSKIKLWGIMGYHGSWPIPDCTSISWSSGEQRDINGMITPFSPQHYTIQFWIKGGNAAQQLFPWQWPEHMTWKAGHTKWKGLSIYRWTVWSELSFDTCKKKYTAEFNL